MKMLLFITMLFTVACTKTVYIRPVRILHTTCKDKVGKILSDITIEKEILTFNQMLIGDICVIEVLQ